MIELARLESAVDAIREFINEEHEEAYDYFESRGLWFQLCSCLDVLDDTCIGIRAYLKGVKKKGAPVDGEKYLRLYGVLQCLFVQQEALKNLCECFEYDSSFFSDHQLVKIRNIRNISVGHPTKRGGAHAKGASSYGFINRSMLTADTFEIETAKLGITVSERHLVPELIRWQLLVMVQSIQNLEKSILARNPYMCDS